MSSIAAASADMERDARVHLERTYPERLYRAVRSAIDEACEELELVNLAGGGECPPRVAAVIRYLVQLAGKPVELPDTCQQALDLLFDLACHLLGHADRIVHTDAGGHRR
jgi:hypothetical protein